MVVRAWWVYVCGAEPTGALWLPEPMDTLGPSRRAVLLTGLVVPLAACTRAAAPGPRPVEPDVALRSAAAGREVALLSAYDRALATASRGRAPGLAALRGEHADHLTALGGASPGPEASAPAPTALSPTTADLLAAEAAALAAHAAGVSAASRALAGVLATLSAAEAAHAVALSSLPAS